MAAYAYNDVCAELQFNQLMVVGSGEGTGENERKRRG